MLPPDEGFSKDNENLHIGNREKSRDVLDSESESRKDEQAT